MKTYVLYHVAEARERGPVTHGHEARAKGKPPGPEEFSWGGDSEPGGHPRRGLGHRTANLAGAGATPEGATEESYTPRGSEPLVLRVQTAGPWKCWRWAVPDGTVTLP